MNLINVNNLLRHPNDIKYNLGDDNIVIPFKKRTIDADKPIDVYRNLNRKDKTYSIRQNGVVVAHTTAVCIRDAEFIVNKSGKNRAIKTKTRNVHAFIRGKYATSGMGTTAKRNDLPITIKYSPFDTYGFHFIHCDRINEVKEAMFVIVNKEGVKASYILK